DRSSSLLYSGISSTLSYRYDDRSGMTQMNTKAKDIKGNRTGGVSSLNLESVLSEIPLPLEIRVHGRGGQGGVTCAKLCALVYSRLGLFAQTFGDYGMERAGAPIRAYTRIDRKPISNRNKIYSPGHLLILDPSLLEAGALTGVAPGSLVLLNTPDSLSSFHGFCEEFRFGIVNATQIARKHGIGTSSVVIVNTAFVGAYARVVGLPIELVRETYSSLGLLKDFAASQEAYDAVNIRDAITPVCFPAEASDSVPGSPLEVIPITGLTQDMPTPLKTGSWRTQAPRFVTLPPPCNNTCPAGNDVVGFVQKLENFGLPAAAEVLFATQPLPSVCGRVCPAPCMESCNRGLYDGAVNIRGLERWIGDHASNCAIPINGSPNPKTIAIVGGGPAGISAAYFLARSSHKVDIFDSQTRLGGVLRSGIPEYRLPEEVLDRDLARVLALGINYRAQESITALRMKQLAVEYDAVIVATGLTQSITPAIGGIDLPGVEQGLTFLNRVKSKGRENIRGTVAVIGGGNTALDCAGTAIRCGADKVVIVYRRGQTEMPAIKEEIRDILAEGVELVLYRQPVRIIGEKAVTGLEVAEVELGDPDESGRKRPIVTDNFSVISCDQVLIAVGQTANREILPSDWVVIKQRVYRGEQPTNVWLAGDFSAADGTVAHAIGSGRKIAKDVMNFFSESHESCVGNSLSIPELVSVDKIRLSCFPRREILEDIHLDVSTRTQSFKEVNLGIASGEESRRCLSCGACAHCDACLMYCPEGIITRAGQNYVINLDYCKGCGICVYECPRHAMEMSPKS
ncbi:MAG: FAD-dependent oxidoreductase, partial [Pseudomonadota bacterium]